LYAVHGDPSAWAELDLGVPPDDRPLYVGKAEDSMASRDLRTHFGNGRTGSSTLRRSLAALLADRLSLVPTPRNPAKPGYFASYGLEPESDERLTAWMREKLLLATWAADTSEISLDVGETQVIRAFLPPLNLAKVQTPWSARVSAARAVMARRAERWTKPPR
jgi:hypothetical protein